MASQLAALSHSITAPCCQGRISSQQHQFSPCLVFSIICMQGPHQCMHCQHISSRVRCTPITFIHPFTHTRLVLLTHWVYHGTVLHLGDFPHYRGGTTLSNIGIHFPSKLSTPWFKKLSPTGFTTHIFLQGQARGHSSQGQGLTTGTDTEHGGLLFINPPFF